MKLINTTTLQLEEFFGTRPEYAILSHTWGDEEVTYQEFVQRSSGAKKGYAKIAASCRLARDGGIAYCWVDTCCIDKSSSAELSEAINSMFGWYNGAKVCFAFLVDLDLDAGDALPQLEHCRWFTRGWCLQELIAPRHVQFYDCRWRLVGTKATLRDKLARITRVDSDVLDDPGGLSACNIARKMSWAARRHTTRVEDMAYCLLGIFDVAMPMLYGEGVKAFTRLQEEIIKKSNDLSIFAWEPGTPREQGIEMDAYVDMFASSPSWFEGCEDMTSHTRGLDVVFTGSPFSITNRGIRFASTVCLGAVGFTKAASLGYYAIDLRCYKRKSVQEIYVLLAKVGPGLYARVNMPGARESLLVKQLPFMEEDVYVLPKVTPTVGRSLQATKRDAFDISIAVGSSSLGLFDLHPREAWDSCRGRFITLGAWDFFAYLRISVRTFSTASEQQKADFFVVGLWFHQESVGALSPSAGFVSSNEWSAIPADIRSMGGESLRYRFGFSGVTELKLPDRRVSLLVRTEISSGQRLHKVEIRMTAKEDFT